MMRGYKIATLVQNAIIEKCVGRKIKRLVVQQYGWFCFDAFHNTNGRGGFVRSGTFLAKETKTGSLAIVESTNFTIQTLLFLFFRLITSLDAKFAGELTGLGSICTCTTVLCFVCELAREKKKCEETAGCRQKKNKTTL